MPTNPLVGQGYDKYIGTRQKPGQTQVEFYNLESGNAYPNPNDLLRAVQPYAGNQIVDESNVFQVLAQGYTPRDTAMNQIKQDLNQFQEQTFNTEPANAKRASSSIADNIASEQGNYDTYFKEYNDLKNQLKALQLPNYQQTYNDLRQSSGIPGIENDFANNQKTIRELPYVNRMNMGNAAGATEGQLNADTAQKGIPLEIQQGNLLDRLKLAQSFIDNSLKFKELDVNASRQSLADALTTTLQTIELSRTHMNDLLEQQRHHQAQQEKAQQFAYENRIGKPFYEIGGTVYRTSDGRPATSPQDYIEMGGTGDFKDVQTVDISQTFANQLALRQVERGELESDRNYQLQRDQFGLQKDEFNFNKSLAGKDFGVIGKDDMGNDVYGFIDLATGTASAATADGSKKYSQLYGKIMTGSDWTYGLDLDLEIGDPVYSPINGTVIAAKPNGLFGNQVKIKGADGNEVWLSHLASGSVQVGQQVTAGMVIGKGGNTGKVIPGKGNNGSHLDVTVKTPKGLMSAKEAQAYVDQQFATQSAANGQPYGPVNPAFTQTLDAVSKSFSSIAPRLPEAARKSAQATINNYIKNGDVEGAKQFILSTAISSLPVEQQNKAFGRATAIDSLNNIESLLVQYKAKGGNTNVLTGTDEQIRQKLGATRNPELAYIGTQIGLSLAAYRQSVSGAAFTESEAKFYENLFPSTSNNAQLNEAKIRSLRDAFNMNQKSVMKTVIGERNYDGLISQNNFQTYATSVSTQSAESAYAAQISKSLIGGNPNPTITNPNINKAKSIAGGAVNAVAKSNPLLAPFTPVINTIRNFFKF